MDAWACIAACWLSCSWVRSVAAAATSVSRSLLRAVCDWSWNFCATSSALADPVLDRAVKGALLVQVILRRLNGGSGRGHSGLIVIGERHAQAVHRRENIIGREAVVGIAMVEEILRGLRYREGLAAGILNEAGGGRGQQPVDAVRRWRDSQS